MPPLAGVINEDSTRIFETRAAAAAARNFARRFVVARTRLGELINLSS
jgi:hypothetical protein